MSNVKTKLQEFQSGKLELPELFRWLAENQQLGFIAYRKGHKDELLTMIPDGHGPVIALFTDELAIVGSGIKADLDYVHGPMLDHLARILKNPGAGIAINPTMSSGVMFINRHLRLLYREYAMAELRRLGGAWVPVKDETLLAIHLPDGRYTTPIYFTEDAAAQASATVDGGLVFATFDQILARAREMMMEAVILQCAFPEQVGIFTSMIRDLAGEPDPNKELERIITEKKGDQAVIEALAKLDDIWVLVDGEGDIVSFEGLVDLFTSPDRVDWYMEIAERKAPQLKGLHAKRYPAESFFRAIADGEPEVAINRGHIRTWMGKKQTLPAVVAQLNKKQ